MQDISFWDSCLRSFEKSLPPQQFNSWIKPLLLKSENGSLVLTAPNRTTAIVTGVAVATETVTSVNASGIPFNPPASATGIVTGTAPVDTLVRALQPLTPGLTGGTPTTVEVAGRFVVPTTLTTGNYSYALPVAAPLIAPYVAMPNVLMFSPDTAAAGKYTVKASLTGFADKAAVLAPLASGATIATNFAFP